MATNTPENPGTLAFATQEEALAGTALDRMMNPRRTMDAIKAEIAKLPPSSGGGGSSGPIDIEDVTGLGDALNTKVNVENYNQFVNTYNALINGANKASGIVRLDSNNKVPLVLLPQLTGSATQIRLSNYLGDKSGDNRADLLQLATDIQNSGIGAHIIIDRPIILSGAWRFTGCKDVRITQEGSGNIQGLRSLPAMAALIRFIDCTRMSIEGVRGWATPSREEDIGFFSDTLNCSHITIRDCIAENLLTGPWHGYSTNCIVDNCKILTPRRDGIHFALGCQDCIAINNYIFDAQDDGIACTTDAPDMTTIGYPYRRTQRIKFINNIVDGGQGRGGSGVIAYDSDHVHIIGNTVRNSATSSIVLSRHIDNQPNCNSCIVADNIIINPGNQKILHTGGPVTASEYYFGCGIFIANAEDSIVCNNNIRHVQANPSPNKAGILLQHVLRVMVRDNRIRDVAGLGIALEGSVQDINIRDNEIDLTDGSGISASELSPGFLGSFISIIGNETRRVARARGFPMNLNLSSAGAVMVARNTDAEGKESSIAAIAGAFLVDNFPTLFMSFNPNFQPGQGSISKSGEVGRYAFEGGSIIFEAEVNLSLSAPGGGLFMLLPYNPRNNNVDGVAFDYQSGLPFIMRHTDNVPGRVMFSNTAGVNQGQAPQGQGLFKASGRFTPKLR